MKLLKTKAGLTGALTIPADKSISHRSIMFWQSVMEKQSFIIF